MAIRHLPRRTDTVIVGNGPSALILSYILHGNIPYYNPSVPHPDPILHQKLSQSPCLFNVNVDDLTAHFSASRISYSTQSLPINVLLDTVLRPLADVDPGNSRSCVEWRHIAAKRRDHVVVGNSAFTGGQWADNPVTASWDVSALSYADMLSLPGYLFKEHYSIINDGELMPDFYRPTRREVANYYATYPKHVGIRDSIYSGITFEGISRRGQGFHIASHDIVCKTLVLASGTFTRPIPPRSLLQPLTPLSEVDSPSDAATLVIGSGFTAADIILSIPPDRKIIHIYKWNPEKSPSPLRACHPSAYPEYAGVYRRMKLAAKSLLGVDSISPMRLKKSNPFFEFPDNYEGLPNTFIEDVSISSSSASILLRKGDGSLLKREVSRLEHAIGRRGSLAYLDEDLRGEVLDSGVHPDVISGHALGPKAERNVQVAPSLFAIGSLTGDSLVRFAYGACVMTAGAILDPMNSSIYKVRPRLTRSTTGCDSLDSEFDHSHCAEPAGSDPRERVNAPYLDAKA